jgi:glycerophosphoryl diester phosphodiesterase
MGHAPENTLASFERGWRAGADALECDVHLSRDGRLVVIHDAVLDRTTDGAGPVGAQPWSRLRLLDAGAWYAPRFRGQRLLRLADLLRWMSRKKTRAGAPLRLVLEVKNEPGYRRIAEAAVRDVRRARFTDRTLLISFDHAVARRAKALCPDLRVGLLYHKRLDGLDARVRRSKADALFPRRHLVTPALMRFARSRGLLVGTWTVNEPAEMRRLVRLGVDAVATNYPERLRRLVDRRS